MDQLSAMRVFCRVVETGSFTRAADALDMPKSTVGKQIGQLEAHLRIKLLKRTTRTVRVTSAAVLSLIESHSQPGRQEGATE